MMLGGDAVVTAVLELNLALAVASLQQLILRRPPPQHCARLMQFYATLHQQYPPPPAPLNPPQYHPLPEAVPPQVDIIVRIVTVRAAGDEAGGHVSSPLGTIIIFRSLAYLFCEGVGCGECFIRKEKASIRVNIEI